MGGRGEMIFAPSREQKRRRDEGALSVCESLRDNTHLLLCRLQSRQKNIGTGDFAEKNPASLKRTREGLLVFFTFYLKKKGSLQGCGFFLLRFLSPCFLFLPHALHTESEPWGRQKKGGAKGREGKEEKKNNGSFCGQIFPLCRIESIECAKGKSGHAFPSSHLPKRDRVL